MKRYKDTKYLITEDGKVWSEYSNKFLAPCDNHGYKNVSLGKDNKKFIHRLVAETYIPNPKGYRCVNHINNDRADNRVENLEWCDVQMNIDHCVKQKRNCFGSKSGNAKLTEEQVVELRKRYKKGGISQEKLGKEYGVDQATVWEIIHYRIWKHVKEPEDDK